MATLAERVTATAHAFHGSAALAQPQVEEEPMEAQARATDFEQDPSFRNEPTLSMRPESPEPAREPTFAVRPDPAPRTEPTLTMRPPYVQGNLHIDPPLPRTEPRPAPSAASRMAQPQRPVQPQPEAPVVHEAHRRSGFLDRLTGHLKSGSATQPAAQPRPAAPAEDAYPQSQPAAQATRISPTDRLPNSRSDEDLLDIPAFLRRQAN
jgi:cell division protein FtsZ